MSLHQGGPLLYVATMEPYGAEERIGRHRAMRRGKGFTTLECPRISELHLIPAGGTVLLEDLGNLAANEIFSGQPIGTDAGVERIWTGLQRIARQAEHLVVVGNDVHRDGGHYDPDTAAYCQALAELHSRIARHYEQVVELVCDLPIQWKGCGK